MESNEATIKLRGEFTKLVNLDRLMVQPIMLIPGVVTWHEIREMAWDEMVGWDRRQVSRSSND